MGRGRDLGVYFSIKLGMSIKSPVKRYLDTFFVLERTFVAPLSMYEDTNASGGEAGLLGAVQVSETTLIDAESH